jgi:hypothetical protein
VFSFHPLSLEKTADERFSTPAMIEPFPKHLIVFSSLTDEHFKPSIFFTVSRWHNQPSDSNMAKLGG